MCGIADLYYSILRDKMIKILKHILITEKQSKKIKELAEKTGSSEASIIRLAIDKLKM